MTAIRYQLAAAGVLLLSGGAIAQQPYLSPASGVEALHTVEVDDLHMTHEVAIESYSDQFVVPEVNESAFASGCHGCGKRACHGVCTDPGHPRKPLIDKPGDRDRGDCPPYRYTIHDCKRAGNPHCVAKWARCSIDDKYSAWFVGGGSPFRFGRCRKGTEGTWGLDYGGLFGHARVWLTYTRFGRDQGGEGAYATDGEPAFVAKAHSLLHLEH